MFLTYPIESFVGRHVLVELIFNGEMEENSGSFIKRRHYVTIALYLMALIPACIFDNLGPVLSISGAVGASCLAYIAPGLVYLGVNGSVFIEKIQNLLPKEPIELQNVGTDAV